jgi:hypothetical protein
MSFFGGIVMNQMNDPNGERQFLHDASNVLALAHGHLHLLIRGIQKNPADCKIEDVTLKLEGIMASVNRLVDLVHARREIYR